MNRPTRPFVVEVKKKRVSPAKRRAIWGDLDLSALTAGALAVTELTSEPAGNVRDPDRAVEVDWTSSTGSAIEIPSEDGDAHAIADANPAEAHPTDAEDGRALSMSLRGRLGNVSDIAKNQYCHVGSVGNVGSQEASLS